MQVRGRPLDSGVLPGVLVDRLPRPEALEGPFDDRGEVVDLALLGVRTIETRATHTVTPSDWPAHHAGVTLKDGTTLPLYDWLPAPVTNGK